jgi:predicted aspartyl protease
MRQIIALAALCLFAVPASADEPCRLIQMAALDMTIDSGGGVDVPMSISGQTVNMLIDTGGIFTMLTEASVQRLGLAKLPVFESQIRMFGGKQIKAYTEARDVNLGGLKAAQLPMQIIPDGLMPLELGGTIAPNIISHYDADFDFANARFRLFSPDHCEGKVVYWTSDPAARISIAVNPEGQIQVPVQIDGHDIEALIDTGSSRSVMSLEAARRVFGIDEKDPKLAPAPAFSGRAFHYPFARLTFQDIVVENPDLILVPDSVSHLTAGVPKLILGMGILRQLHMYIAYKEKKLYATAASAH